MATKNKEKLLIILNILISLKFKNKNKKFN